MIAATFRSSRSRRHWLLLQKKLASLLGLGTSHLQLQDASARGRDRLHAGHLLPVPFDLQSAEGATGTGRASRTRGLVQQLPGQRMVTEAVGPWLRLAADVGVLDSDAMNQVGYPLP